MPMRESHSRGLDSGDFPVGVGHVSTALKRMSSTLRHPHDHRAAFGGVSAPIASIYMPFAAYAKVYPAKPNGFSRRHIGPGSDMLPSSSSTTSVVLPSMEKRALPTGVPSSASPIGSTVTERVTVGVPQTNSL